MELYNHLKEKIARFPSALIAYSGGVDSALVAKVAFDLFREKAVALTALSPAFPSYQFEETKKVAAWIGIRHLIVDSHELENPDYSANPVNRCYFCKSELYTLCEEKAKELGLSIILNGFNADDQSDWRPGFQAQKEHAVQSPLLEAGLGKKEIREVARFLGLPIWEKPASPCLSSRFPYGHSIDEKKLRQVDQVESFLKTKGFLIFRARHYGPEVRLELGIQEQKKILDETLRHEVEVICHTAGFEKIMIDPEGFRSGHFNDHRDP